MNNQNTKPTGNEKGTDANRDPITGAPGAHPVGAGVGTAGGAAAGAAAGSLGGPIGAAIGLVAGGVAGGLAGKSLAEKMDPTVEDAYWRANYSRQPYVDASSAFATYQAAYRTGYEGRVRYPEKNFEEVEADLQSAYQRSKGSATLGWDKARAAARDAWNRIDRNLSGRSR